MRTHGKVSGGSSSLFETQGVLRSSIGHAIWFGQFTPVGQDHMIFRPSTTSDVLKAIGCVVLLR
jgi:hypothetical protein